MAFEIRAAEVDERTAGEAEEVVVDNALRKARAVAREFGEERLVIGADTAVVLDGRIYGKAHDVAEARAHLERLSGREHVVWSALALVEGERERWGTERTAVTFRQLDGRALEWYLESEEWRERAGSYAIQGRGAALVERIAGDYWNVVGLPVALLLRLVPDLLG